MNPSGNNTLAAEPLIHANEAAHRLNLPLYWLKRTVANGGSWPAPAR